MDKIKQIIELDDRLIVNKLFKGMILNGELKQGDFVEIETMCIFYIWSYTTAFDLIPHSEMAHCRGFVTKRIYETLDEWELRLKPNQDAGLTFHVINLSCEIKRNEKDKESNKSIQQEINNKEIT